MPEIIDGVTYKTTPGGRPYPEAGSPGKAFWQLIERAMRELDDFETYELAAMTAQITALSGLVTNSSVQRRLLSKTNSQSIPANGYASIVLTGGDARRLDPGQPAPSPTKGIRLSADGTTVTAEVAGLYQLAVYLPANTAQTYAVIRRNGIVLGKQSNGTSSAGAHVINLITGAAAGDTFDVYFRNGFGSAISVPSNAAQQETTTFESGGTYATPTFDVLRLGA